MGTSSCTATRVSVKEINSDRKAYLTNAFSPQALDDRIVKRLETLKLAQASFREANIRFTVVYETSQKKQDLVFKGTYLNAGKGFVQQYLELTNNDVPYALAFSINYAGILVLKSQEVGLNSAYPRNRALVINDISMATLDLSNPKIGDESTFKYEADFEFTAVHDPRLLNCRTMDVTPAVKLHSKLVGNAVILGCDLQINGVLQKKSTYGFLSHYGFAVLLEEKGSAYKILTTITDVEIR